MVIVIRFNFNKCCIWIQLLTINHYYFLHLTLTNVVFELTSNNTIINIIYNLTLTNVVFELPKFVVPLWLYVI